MWQILTILVLLGMMLGLQSFDVQVPAGEFNPKSLAATGFIILAAFTMGELFKRFKIPALLGYIVAGIAFGPNLAKLVFGANAQALFDLGVITDLGLINVLTVGVIGTMGGGELKVSDIKESWKTILMLIVLIIVTAIPLTFLVVMGLIYGPGDLVGFLNDEALRAMGDRKTMHRVAAALLFAIMAVAMSPAATLAILQESKAKGKFTSLVLGVVVVADLALVALFLVGLSLAKLLISPEGFSSGALLGALPGIGLEFAWALVIGAVMGVLFILYIRYVEREMMLFTVAIIFAGSYVCKMMHAETLLAFLTAGFVVQNFSKHGHDLIHALEKISLPVFIIYFMTQAAQLDLAPVVQYLPVTLILACVRAASYYGSARVTTRVVGADAVTQRYLWMSFLSRGGVDLVLAAMVAGAIEPWGKDVQTIIMSTVVVHIVMGPPLLKYALSGAGETEDGRQERHKEAESLSTLGGEAYEHEELPRPSFPDPYLNGRLTELRDQLETLHSRQIEAPLTARSRQLAESLEHLRAEISLGLESLHEMLDERHGETVEQQHKALIHLHTQTRRKLQPWIQLWEHLPPVAFSANSAQRLIDELRGMEDFESHYIVELEAHLYDGASAHHRHERVLRALRRAQRAFTGTSRRTIPIGRLWRYYMELAVPRYLASKVNGSASAHEIFWHEVEHYIHRFDEVFFVVEQLILGEEIEYSEGSAPKGDVEHAAEEQQAADGEHGDEADEDSSSRQTYDVLALLQELPTDSITDYERAQALVREYRVRHEEFGLRLDGLLEESLRAATSGYSFSLYKAFESFLQAVARAGTLELPAFMYRPSTQYDVANRAEEQLRQRLKREANIVSAYIGWIVVDHQLTLFVYWFEQYQARIVDSLEGFFHKQAVRQLDRLKLLCERGPWGELEEGQEVNLEDEIHWAQWRQQELTPLIQQVRRTLERAMVSFGKGMTSRRLIDTLEYRVARISEEVTLLVEDPEDITPEQIGSLSTMKLKIRQWFSRRLVNEIALQYIDFNERLDRIVRRKLMGIDELEQVIDYNLLAAQRELEETHDRVKANTLARSGLQRARKQIEELATLLVSDVREVERWIVDETTQLVEATTSPFMDHELKGVQQELLRLKAQQQERPLEGLRARTSRALKQTRSALAPLYAELIEDVRQLLRDEQRPQQRAQVRAALGVDKLDPFDRLPPIYRRLFNPVPLDLPEFYISRPALEAQVLKAISQWGKGEPSSILLFGDRGVGKRTFIHNLVPIQVYDLAESFQNTPIQTIRLADDVVTEAEICQQFWPLFERGQPRTFDALQRRLLEIEERQIVIVENATKCYSRTARGFAQCEALMEVLSASSERVLWMLLMEAPAAVLLDTMLDLFDYFTHVFELEPLDEAQIEQMIIKRHRVSGFEVSFEAPSMRLFERATHPLAASEATRQPKHEFFKRLAHQSGGNPLLAMLYWLRTIELDQVQETKLHVHALPTQRLAVSEALTLRKKLMLSLLLQHSALPIGLLAEMLGMNHSEVRTELEHLRRLGLVEEMAGVDGYYQLRDVAAPALTRELRQINLS